MSLWHCVAHGISGPTACCAQAVSVSIELTDFRSPRDAPPHNDSVVELPDNLPDAHLMLDILGRQVRKLAAENGRLHAEMQVLRQRNALKWADVNAPEDRV